VAPSCVAFEFQSFPSQVVETIATWNNQTITNYANRYPDDSDVLYKYVLVSVADALGKTLAVVLVSVVDADTHHSKMFPYHVDVSHAKFPLTLKLFQENEVEIASMIHYNYFVQWSCLAWLALSLLCLWGYFGLSVIAPGFHALQQGCALMVVYSAVAALQNPPSVVPPLGEQDQDGYHGCKSISQGLRGYCWVLTFQSIITFCLPLAAELVRRPILPLIEFSKAFQGIKVGSKSNNNGDIVCSICLDSLSDDPMNVKDLDVLWTLPCSHTYHKDCILPWLAKPGESLGTCPLCRGDSANVA